MSPVHQSRSRVFGIATMFAFTLLAPVAVSAQEVADTTQQEVPVLAPVPAPAVISTSGEDGRAIAAERALLNGDIGSIQEEHLYAIVAAASSWDDTSGYRSVETSRATIGHAPASMTEEAALLAQFRAIERTLSLSLGPAPQVPADVRWAPTRAIAPDAEAAATRVRAAEQALQSHDLGSVQEEHLYAIVAAASSWDETSGYSSVEASRATIGHPTTSTNDALPAALERGTRAESAVLWTILHQDDAVSVNPSDDRIAAALFDD